MDDLLTKSDIENRIDNLNEALLKLHLEIETAKTSILEAQIILEELRREHNGK